MLPVEPIGYPKSAAICGSNGCENVAYIWLTNEERDEYFRGRRIFQYPSQAMKVQVIGPDEDGLGA
ncbi:hypothetical protein BCCGELA001_29945 [Bradyrhizobium sp. CCGE-LA001]|nr:hypothetical protein BCCGELA001_29945 [Bradyrhizobium sp. CCGE-LA001]